MFPKVIVHNSISLDGSLTGFQPNMMLHYRIAGNYCANAHLVGSNTIRVGVEMYESQVPLEEEKDYEKPKRDNNLPYWVIPDTKGKLRGLLHTCRWFEFCRDIIVLVSEQTPKAYLDHLTKRNYAYEVVGKENVDLEKSLEILSSKYKVKKVMADTGRILGNLLINQGFAKELSLLVHPNIVGKKSYNIFGNIDEKIDLKLKTRKIFPNGCLWLLYIIKKK